MMKDMYKARLAGAVLAAVIGAPTAWGGAMPPEPGKYLAHITVSDAQGVGCFGIKSGDSLTGTLNYAGFSAKRTTLRYFLRTGFESQVLYVYSGAGTIQLSGMFTSGHPPLGVAEGPFRAVITPSDDPESFSMTLAERWDVLGPCCEVFQISLMRIGPV
jgi:hypothetical protein